MCSSTYGLRGVIHVDRYYIKKYYFTEFRRTELVDIKSKHEPLWTLLQLYYAMKYSKQLNWLCGDDATVYK